MVAGGLEISPVPEKLAAVGENGMLQYLRFHCFPLESEHGCETLLAASSFLLSFPLYTFLANNTLL